MYDGRRKIPSIDRLLKNKELQKYTHKLAKEVLKTVIEGWQKRLRSHEVKKDELEKIIVKEAVHILERGGQNFRQVINATGIILNTNLGRAPIPHASIPLVVDILTGYSNLEIDLVTGKRKERYSHLSELFYKLTGAEDFVVVNNNAAAVFLVLDTFGKDKEVVVSRGELIEIGGSFRLPDVIKKSSCRLIEVGTTNRTYIEDYEQAINENTRIILKTHPSNYKIIGFTQSPTIEEFVELGHKYNVLTMQDLGSGLLIDITQFGFPYEPVVKDIVKSGIDIVTFSGDKLLGGPQAGIVLSKKELIKEMKKNPLIRALRVDKYTLAVLESVLRIYLYEDNPVSKIPSLSMLLEPLEKIKKKANKLYTELHKGLGKRDFSVGIEKSVSETGGGSCPGTEIPTFVVTISSKNYSANKIYSLLMTCKPPIIGRIKDDKVLLDVRTIFDNEIDIILKEIQLLFRE
jgi:L-seryl-tRNA(Ser) seleniumtransferase